MSDKQTLQAQITQLKSVLASPKTDGTTRKILENGLKKAEAKLEELEKAEKLEDSKKELTPKQEAKVEEVKTESKSLAQALKEKVKQAKQKIATTTPKATKKGGARSVARAKELAKQMRSTQKKQSLADKDIESDANRYAINKTKRKSHGGRANQYGTKAENTGGTYYEKRENRYDRQNKRYAKLEGGGMTNRLKSKLKEIRENRDKVEEIKQEPSEKNRYVLMKLDKKLHFGMIMLNNIYTKREAEVLKEDYEKNIDKDYYVKIFRLDELFKRESLNSQTKDRFKEDLEREKMLYHHFGTKNSIYADGGVMDFGGTKFSSEDLSGMFAKGGMTEHGLQVGDMIVSTSTEPYSIIVRNNGVEALVNLNEGTRINDIYSHKDGMKQGTRFRHSKDPMVVRSQFEEEEFEYAKGGTTKKFKVDDVVYNKRTKTIGIVRMEDERGETKTDADGNVNTSELQHYNPMKYANQKDGKVAPSTEKEINTRGLWNPFKVYADGGTTQKKKYDDGGIVSKLQGKRVKINFLGGGSGYFEIDSASITPPHYSHRDVSLYTKKGTVDKFPYEKLNDFISGKEVKIMGGKEPYTIELVGRFEDGGSINDFGGTKYSTEDLSGMFGKGGGVSDGVEMSRFHRNIMGTLSFDLKLNNMRKSQEFIVYPISKGDDYILIQSDTRIGRIFMSNGMGKMSQSHPNGAYGVHLQMDKLTPFQLDPSQILTLREELAKTAGKNVGSSVVKTDNEGASQFMFAKGGMTEHGLKNGDKIISNKVIGTTIRVRNEGLDEDARVDLNTGKRTILTYNSKTKKWDEKMEKGGDIEVKEGDMIKSKTIKGKVYQSMGTMFKIEDEHGNKNPKFYSTRDFKKSEIIKMGMGGKTTFDDKVKAISKKLDGKKVAPSVQKDYGKRYSKSEAIDSAKRIVGAMRKKEMAKKKR